MLAKVLSAIVGPGGSFMPEYGTLRAVVCDGMFRSYYKKSGQTPSDSLVQNLANGSARPRRWILQHYAGDDGYDRLYSDMVDFVDSCTSLHRLRRIKQGVHKELARACDIDLSRIRHSEREDLTRDEIAEYFTDVLHYAMQARLSN